MTEGLISLILPVHNQGDYIANIVEEYERELGHLPNPHELILVVNNSRDNSLEVCRALAAKTPSIHTLYSKRGGWGLAVRLGVNTAKGDLICYTNSARTSSNDLLLLLLYAIVNRNVIIKANRKIRDNWTRRFGSLIYNIEVRTLFDLAYWDINGTPKVFPRVFEKLLHLKSDDDLIDAEFNAVCKHEGYPMLEIPIFSTRRHGGKSTTNFKSAIHMYTGAIRLRRRLEREWSGKIP